MTDLLLRLEQRHDLSTREAADLLGLAYPRYMEFRRGARALKPYHRASIQAHMHLSTAIVRSLLAA